MINAAQGRTVKKNRMLTPGCAAALLLALASVSAAAAGNMAACRTAKMPEARIDACSAIIHKGAASVADRAEAFRRRGDAHAARTAYREADADYTEALRLEPASVPALTGRASARLASGDNVGAVSDLTDALRIDGGSAGLFVARGYARLLQENADEAIADFTAALAKQPSNASALNNRGLAHRKKGDTAAAIADYTAAIRINPSFAQAYANRGYVYEAQGDKLAATADLERALSLDPALTGAAKGLERLGHTNDATARSDALISHGKELAQKNCAWCHAIGRTGESPNPRAPRWIDMAGRHPILALREPLSRGIARPHDEMPKFELSAAEVDTIIDLHQQPGAVKLMADMSVSYERPYAPFAMET